MMLDKRKPWRSPAFMKFCHERMRGAMCCTCGEKPWVQLHHWGDDGGMGLKPTDLKLARVCRKCHDKYGYKERALMSPRCGLGLETARLILSNFRRDAIKLLEAYVQYLEGDEGQRHDDCSVDELNEWLATEAHSVGPDKQRNWLLAWADRRAAEIVEAYEERVEGHGQDEDRVVR